MADRIAGKMTGKIKLIASRVAGRIAGSLAGSTMGDTVERPETAGVYPEEQESSQIMATPADSTIAGKNRHTVIEPRTLETNSAVEPDSRRFMPVELLDSNPGMTAMVTGRIAERKATKAMARSF